MNTHSTISKPQSHSSTPHARFTPLDPVRILKQYKWLLLIITILSIAFAIGLTMFLARVAPQYRATAQLEVIGQLVDPSQTSTPSNTGRDFTLYQATQVALITQDGILQGVLQVPAVRQTQWYQSTAKKHKTVETRHLREALDVRPQRGSTLINIRMTCEKPQDTSIIANAVAEEFVETRARAVRTTDSEIREIFQRNLNNARTRVETIDQQMKDLLAEGGLDDPDARLNESVINFQIFSTQKIEAEQQMKLAKRAYETLIEASKEGTFEYTPEEEAQVDEHPFIRERDNRILKLNEDRRVQIDRLGENHRTIHEIDLRIQATQIEMEKKRSELLADLKDLRLSNAKNLAEATAAHYNDITNRLEETRKQKQDLAQKIAQYNNLRAERQRALDDIADANRKIQTMLTRTERPDAFRVQHSARAIPPGIRHFPQYQTMIPAVVIITLMLTLALLFVREILDQRIKSPACKSLLPPCNLLGVIPSTKDDPSAPKKLETVVGDQPSGLLAESFRKTRTEIIQNMERNGYKTLMVAGSQPEVGTSTLVSNIGISIAMNGKRVLVIDANIRKPRLGSIFGVSGPGLAELLTGEATTQDAVHASRYEGLSVLPVGSPSANTYELLEGKSFADLLNELKSQFDFIIIDTPPLAIVGDGAQLSNYVDAIALVVRAMKEKRGLISRMINQISNMNAAMLGMVFNDVQSAAGGYYRRNYKTFYDYQKTSRGK